MNRPRGDHLVHILKPAVPRHVLFAVAAAAWLAAGGILCTRAAIWLLADSGSVAMVLAAGGVIIAFVFFKYMFASVARKNIARISGLPESPCIFAFAAWRGYFMIVLMVTIGIMLRTSPLPRDYLVVPYIAMGGALVFASLLFARMFWNHQFRKATGPPGV